MKNKVLPLPVPGPVLVVNGPHLAVIWLAIELARAGGHWWVSVAIVALSFVQVRRVFSLRKRGKQ